jgi:anthranilate/para-aminobenzoate synthase component II
MLTFDVTVQVVRYHSLMLDVDSLSEDLIPTAWTIDTGNDIFCQKVTNGTTQIYYMEKL